MLDWLKPILDSYDRTARLKPALLSGLGKGFDSMFAIIRT